MSSTDNKRIAKNTIFLYFRMLIAMGIALYTSRVVLRTLGVNDYGIYNVVGGVVVMFTFINQAMATATQRYFSFELGKKQGSDISKIFTITLRIHIGIAAIVLLLAETVGLWFLNTKMNFPDGSFVAINWVYQFSIMTCLATIIRVPYNGLIISYEQMSFYALSSIIESILKLLIVFILIVSPLNKLIFYSFLVFLVTTIVTLWYVYYCKRQYHDAKYNKYERYAKETKEIIKFSSWATFGSFATISYMQGVNILLNIGYGVVVNAAVAIATQINSAITQFVSGFQQALNPQLVKSEACHDKVRQESLIIHSSKFSFFIMLVIAVPIIINIKYILNLWLGEYPTDAIFFSQLILLGALIECLTAPFWVTIFATGKIKTYQVVTSILMLMNIPLAYLFEKLGYEAYVAFIIRDVIFVIHLVIRIIFLKVLINFNWIKFLKKVIYPTFIVLVCIILSSWLWITKVGYSNNFYNLLWQSGCIILFCLTIIYFVGLSDTEKNYIKETVLAKIKQRC